MSKLNRVVVNSKDAPQPIGLYSQAIITNSRELIFIAGQVSVNNEGDLVGKNDVNAQTKQVFKNLGAILSSVGASFTSVVEFTTYVVGRKSIQGYIETRSDIFSQIYSDNDFPSNTLLVVEGLVREDFLLEIKAVAALP